MSFSHAGQSGIIFRVLVHPVIRIIAFVIFGTFISLGDYRVLAAGAVVFGGVWLWAGRGVAVWGMVRRMRWLFLSILVLYIAFTPGQPLFDLPWAPSVNGLAQGAVRVTALLLLMTTANLLVTVTPRPMLLEALYWLARPFTWLGLSRERFAVRVTLVLEALAGIQELIDEAMASVPATDNRIARIAGVMTASFQAALTRADAAALDPIEFHPSGAPPLYQWLLPVLLTAGFWIIA